MVEISDRSLAYGFVAAAGIKRGARALSQVSSAAGRQVELTQTSLRPQANNMSRLGGRMGQLVGALNGIEEARGITRSQELTQALSRATQRAVNRLLQAESASNAQVGSAVFGARPGASIADVVRSSRNDDAIGAAIFTALANRLPGATGGSRTAPAPTTLVATAATRNDTIGDIFERDLPTQVRAQGAGRVEVSRRALETTTRDVLIDPANPEAILPTVVVRDAGRATASNEGFVVRASTGERGGTLALDLGDPGGGDSRVGLIEATGGAGSDVIFLSGANNALVRAGAGNDYVMADGSAEIYGGAGDDILIGNIVFGEDGDDMLFGSALAVGGAGNDRITMFSLEEGEEAAQGLAFGGDGDDVIVGESVISADGGDGNDAIALRAGGFANGGLGNDTLTAFGDATLEGGDGDDNLFLLAGGSIDGGAGKDDITATQYATVRGGAGDDIVRMNAGGVYRYSAGDGRDSVLLSSPLNGIAADWSKPNRIELSGFARADVELLVSSTDVVIVPRDPASGDRLTVTRTVPGEALEIVLTKGDVQQTVAINGSDAVWGPVVKPAPPVV